LHRAAISRTCAHQSAQCNYCSKVVGNSFHLHQQRLRHRALQCCA
jgi:hypothetical protein